MHTEPSNIPGSNTPPPLASSRVTVSPFLAPSRGFLLTNETRRGPRLEPVRDTRTAMRVSLFRGGKWDRIYNLIASLCLKEFYSTREYYKGGSIFGGSLSGFHHRGGENC